jgi:hypothetical protein
LYLPLAYPTDSELDSLRHVEVISPGSRDPNSEVDDHNDEACFDTIDDPDAHDDNDFFQINNGYFLPDDATLNATNRFAAIAHVNSQNIQCAQQHNWEYDNLQKNLTLETCSGYQGDYGCYSTVCSSKFTPSTKILFNVQCLDEDVSTDTYFANVTAHDGLTCAQLFVGKVSFLTIVFGMRSDCEFPSTLLIFIHSFGAMNCLISDNAKAELSSGVKNILRQFHSTACQSEPYYQNQNPSERCIQFENLLSRL